MASRWCCRDAIFWAPNPQRRVACRQVEVLASLEYPCCGAGICGQPVEVFFGKGFG